MATTTYFDSAIKHQVDLIRVEQGETRRIVRILREADDKIDTILAKRNLPRYGTKAYDKIVERILGIRKEAMAEIKTILTDDMRRLVDIERTTEIRALRAAGIDPGDVDLNTLRKRVLHTPFSTSPGQMALFDDWLKSLALADTKRVADALASAARTRADARKLLVGTSGAKYKDGLLSRTHRNAEAIVRTSFTHLSSVVREAIWNESNRIVAYRWTAMLDRRLCPICLSHHGKYVPVAGHKLPKGLPALTPVGLRPPLHANCRCVLVPLFSLDALTDLPTADDWLTGQSAESQNAILGVRRAKLYRDGKIDADAMTNQVGRLLTLDQLGE